MGDGRQSSMTTTFRGDEVEGATQTVVAMENGLSGCMTQIPYLRHACSENCGYGLAKEPCSATSIEPLPLQFQISS